MDGIEVELEIVKTVEIKKIRKLTYEKNVL